MKTRRGIGVVAFLLAIVVFPAPADQLPAYCGAVGATSYTPPPVTIPAVVLNRGTVITVTNATMDINGDTSSVKALVANPGPDGISLQEAVMATNNDRGTWNIQFAPTLKGSTIVVDSAASGPKGLSYLTGGNVTINGDIDGDGKPDITLSSLSGTATSIFIISGGNTLNGLALQNCSICVQIQRPSAKFQLPGATGTTFSGITISNMVMTNIQNEAIVLAPVIGEAGLGPSSPALATGNTWDHVLITGNTITGNVSGPVNAIDLGLGGTVGDTLQHTAIANNNIDIETPGGGGIQVDGGGGIASTNDQVLDTLIANNTISGATPQFGIRMAAAGDSASANLIDGVRIIANQLRITGQLPSSSEQPIGIQVLTGDGASDDLNPPVLPVQYSVNNIARNIGILSNTIQGAFGFGIFAVAACCGNGSNSIDNLSILGNTMTGNVQLQGGGSGGFVSRPSIRNSLSNVLIQANSIRSLTLPGNPNFTLEESIASAGIGVWGGSGAVGNSFNGLSIANNDVNTAFIGIGIVGGYGLLSQSNSLPTTNNVVSAAQIFCNQLDQASTLGITPASGVKSINVVAGVDVASANQVQAIVVDNLVAGVPGDASLFANLGGASGNTLSTSGTLTPAIYLVANAEGESPVIAPNAWIEIRGVDLAPPQDALNVRTWVPADFLGNQMPVQLDGVGVTVNNKSAYVYYVNPSQVNVLTPPDAIGGSVNVVVTNNGVSSAPFAVQAQPISPSFFVFDGAHVVGVHLDGTDIGPATLYPGLTTPAKPGETIVLFANGFGPTSTPVVSGAVSQSGSLSPMPVIRIGGIQANVRFAGLNTYPGEFQFNVDVPLNIADGDQPITATYDGVGTQSGAVLAVQH